MPDETKFIVFRGEVLTLTRAENNLWTDDEGVIFALVDDAASVDKEDRCGIHYLSFPSWHPLTAACKVHDYMYSSPAYQVFHTRAQADRYLGKLIRQIKYWWWLARPFEWLAHTFGKKYWENKLTA